MSSMLPSIMPSSETVASMATASSSASSRAASPSSGSTQSTRALSGSDSTRCSSSSLASVDLNVIESLSHRFLDRCREASATATCSLYVLMVVSRASCASRPQRARASSSVSFRSSCTSVVGTALDCLLAGTSASCAPVARLFILITGGLLTLYQSRRNEQQVSIENAGSEEVPISSPC